MKLKEIFNGYVKRKKEYKTLILTLIIILILGMALKGNIKDIFGINNDANLEKYEDYLEVVGKSKECRNTIVTLESAVADKNVLMLSFIVKNSDKKIENLKDADVHINSLTINGKEMYLISKNNLELLNDNEMRIVKRISWNFNELPKNLNISIGIRKMFESEGNWDIRFNVDTEKILKDIYEENVNICMNLKNLKGYIKKAVISPLTIKLESVYTSKNDSSIGFLVLNEDDEELISIGESKSKDLNQYEYSSKYVSNEPLDKLNIIPIYYGKDNEKDILTCSKVNMEEFHQFYLEVSDNLYIKIEDCLLSNGYLIIKYNYEYNGKVITPDLNDLYVKSDGIVYDAERDDKIKQIKKEYASDDYKIAVFKCDIGKELEIGCYDGGHGVILEEYSFKIDTENRKN